MTKTDIEDSLYQRAFIGMYDSLEELYLNDGMLERKEADYYRKGVDGFMNAMVLISKNNLLRNGKGKNIPFIIHRLIRV